MGLPHAAKATEATAPEATEAAPAASSRLASVLRLSGNDVAPKRFDIVRIEDVVPRRHVALAVSHRIDKPCVGVAREVAQIDCPLRVAHLRAMASCAVARVELRSFFNLLGRKLRSALLRRRGCASKRKREAYGVNDPHIVLQRVLIWHQGEGPH